VIKFVSAVNHNPEKPCHFSIIINAIVLSIKENVSIYFVNEDFTLQLIFLRFVFMVSNATFNNISVISWRSVPYSGVFVFVLLPVSLHFPFLIAPWYSLTFLYFTSKT
jgi:hypothetical protein